MLSLFLCSCATVNSDCMSGCSTELHAEFSASAHCISTSAFVVSCTPCCRGYLLTQVVGGVAADRLGGKVVLGLGVVWWSLATVLTPIAAQISLPVLLGMRALMGIGEGVAMPAMNNMLSRWVPAGERSRSLALVYSGMYTGSMLGLGVSPGLINNYGWPSVFYIFGVFGVIWWIFWTFRAHSTPAEDPRISKSELDFLNKNTAVSKVLITSYGICCACLCGDSDCHPVCMKAL